MLGWKNCFIMYDNVGFTQKTLWGKERYFTYDQVTALQKERRNPIDDVILFVNEKKVTFSSRTENADYFMMILQSRYRQIHGKKTIPEFPKHIQERGGFRAHVYNPGQYLVILIVFIVMIVGVGAWIVVDNLQPVSENDCEMYTVSFSAWEIDDAELILTTPQMKEKFEIRGYREYLSGYNQLTAKCDGQVYFTVWAKRIKPRSGPAYFRVDAISSGEEVYRTFEDSTAYNISNIPFYIGVFGVFLIIVLVMAILTYFVGSNPQKFPRWVVHVFFREGAIDI
ncbi:MAG: hypothetical protein E7283_02830 [Lachnospiraceae bacterium]|nr:hypothetical protein [Lachnospiraceae bacterium]